jgi:hypothetical protein
MKVSEEKAHPAGQAPNPRSSNAGPLSAKAAIILEALKGQISVP